jgi:glycosyltransferase involved in cell wall biosynthesis
LKFIINIFYLPGEFRMKIDYINGPKTDKIFGMYKYQMEIQKRLNVVLNVIEYQSLMQNLEKRFITSNPANSTVEYREVKNSKFKNSLVDAGRKTLQGIDRYRYRTIVKNSVNKDNIKHITSQELAYLLKYIDMEKTVVTCFDLIPWAFEHNHSKIWKDIMDGLGRADEIITISQFSKMEIMKYLDYPEENIHIVNVAVDHDYYQPKRDKTILNQFNIPDNHKIILYVGSETPRMNLDFLLKSLAKLKKTFPDFKLLKVGEPQSFGARKQFLHSIKEMGLENDVIFVGYVDEVELPKWYNASDLLVYPCLYAGFGVPPLEAMACGTPVITSNTSSLPEVVGDAGVMVDPIDSNSMAEKIFEVLNNNSLWEDMAKKGLKQSKRFNWDESANKTSMVYKKIEDQ